MKERNEKRKEIKKNERHNRENFKKLLDDHKITGTLTYKTKWKNFIELVKNDERLLNMVIYIFMYFINYIKKISFIIINGEKFGQSGSTAKDLFED